MDTIVKLEELWRSRPEAGLDDLEAGAGEEVGEVAPVALRYDSAEQYQARWAATFLSVMLRLGCVCKVETVQGSTEQYQARYMVVPLSFGHVGACIRVRGVCVWRGHLEQSLSSPCACIVSTLVIMLLRGPRRPCSNSWSIDHIISSHI